MRRNLLSVGHVVLLGATLLTLAGCADIKGSPWEATSPKTAPASETAIVPPASAPATDTIGAVPVPDVTKISQQTKVGLLLPLSGKGAETGQAMLNAAQLAMFDLNATSVFELLPEDTGAGAEQAVRNVLNKGATLVLGPVFSSDTKTVAPIALQKGVPVVSFSTDTSAAMGNSFLMGFMPQTQIRSVLGYAASSGLKRVALVAARDVYGDSAAVTYVASVQKLGLSNVAIVRYTAGTLPSEADFAALKAGVDAVLIAASGTESHKISNTLTSAGIPSTIAKRLGTGLWDQPDVAKLSGLQGAWYAASSPRLRSRFEKRYMDTYGSAAPRLASLAYDATALSVVLAKSGNGFSRATLTNPNGFAGIDGIFRFSEDGLADRGLAILEISNGSSRIIQDAPQRFIGR